MVSTAANGSGSPSASEGPRPTQEGGRARRTRRLSYGLTHADPNSRVWVEQAPAQTGPRRFDSINLVCDSVGSRTGITSGIWFDGTIPALAEEGLVARFEPVKAQVPSFSLRLVGEPVLLSPAEWCGPLWRAATISMLRLLARLAMRDLSLESVRPEFMLLAPGCRPVYMRPGSIAPADAGSAIRTFRQLADFFVLPLYLCSTGRSATLRDLLARGDSLAPVRAFPELAQAADLAARQCLSGSPGGYEGLGGQIAAMNVPFLSETFWSRYYPPDVSPNRSEQWPYKIHAVDRILETMMPATMVDLAANTGLYSRLAAAKGIRVIAIDNDEACIARLFRSAREEALAIFPVLGDICFPAEIVSFPERVRRLAQRRFGSELVLALAISHHLVFSPPWLGFAEVADLFWSFSQRYLLTEFVGLEPEAMNPYHADDRPGCSSWYRLDHFLDGLRRRFRNVVLVPGPKGRQLVLAER